LGQRVLSIAQIYFSVNLFSVAKHFEKKNEILSHGKTNLGKRNVALGQRLLSITRIYFSVA
jgi:predicted component of type VI protein secretion system